VLEWVRDALHASHADERREHEEAIKRHQAEYKRLQDRINAMYVDKLDGLVEATFFERMSNQWREEHREAGTARKAPATQFPAIELHLGRWQRACHLPPTV
jgi:hypothetical protein